MTAAITNYTNTDKVRAALGVDASDVPDQKMVDMQLDIELTLDLDEFGVDHVTIYTEGTDVAPTAAQTKSWNLLQMYSQYCAAYLALDGKQLQYPLLFKDGKAEIRRFEEIDFDELLASIGRRKRKYQDLLAEDQGITLDTVSSYSPLGVSTPGFDPVTGV